MASILTNVSAMTALESLNKTNKALCKTQNRISTGYRVGSAEDNAAYWSIATTMRSDNSALSTVKDALGLGAATIDVAYTAMNTAIDVTKEIKNKLVAARQPGIDRTKIQAEITELQNQLKGIADSAVFSGENWLSVDSFLGRLQRHQDDRLVLLAHQRHHHHRHHPGRYLAACSSTMQAPAQRRSASSMRCAMQRAPLRRAGTFSVATLDISALTDSAADIATLAELHHRHRRRRFRT